MSPGHQATYLLWGRDSTNKRKGEVVSVTGLKKNISREIKGDFLGNLTNKVSSSLDEKKKHQGRVLSRNCLPPHSYAMEKR